MCIRDRTCHDKSRHVMTCHDMSWHVVTCHDMSWHVMTCHDMSWHVMTCHENSDENRRKSPKIDFPKIDRDHSGSIPRLQKPRKTFETHDFGPKANRNFSGLGIHPRRSSVLKLDEIRRPGSFRDIFFPRRVWYFWYFWHFLIYRRYIRDISEVYPPLSYPFKGALW